MKNNNFDEPLVNNTVIKIDWYDNNTKNIIHSITRETPNALIILETIKKAVTEKQDLTNYNLRISVKMADTETVQMDTTCQDAIDQLQKTIVPESELCKILGATIYQLFMVSNLKGAILTLVHGDAKVSGIGMINASLSVTPEDIKVLASAAEGQVDLFKTKFRRSGIIFDGDKGKIIVPSDAYKFNISENTK